MRLTAPFSVLFLNGSCKHLPSFHPVYLYTLWISMSNHSSHVFRKHLHVLPVTDPSFLSLRWKASVAAPPHPVYRRTARDLPGRPATSCPGYEAGAALPRSSACRMCLISGKDDVKNS